MSHNIDDIIKAISICTHVGTGVGRGCTQCPYYFECLLAIRNGKEVPIWNDVLQTLRRYADVDDEPKYKFEPMKLRDICQKILEGEDIEFSEADELGACENSIWSHICLLGDNVVIEELRDEGDTLDFKSGNVADIMQSMVEYGYTHPWYFVRTKA